MSSKSWLQKTTLFTCAVILLAGVSGFGAEGSMETAEDRLVEELGRSTALKLSRAKRREVTERITSEYADAVRGQVHDELLFDAFKKRGLLEERDRRKFLEASTGLRTWALELEQTYQDRDPDQEEQRVLRSQFKNRLAALYGDAFSTTGSQFGDCTASSPLLASLGLAAEAAWAVAKGVTGKESWKVFAMVTGPTLVLELVFQNLRDHCWHSR